jgi:hypothetical protein
MWYTMLLLLPQEATWHLSMDLGSEECLVSCNEGTLVQFAKREKQRPTEVDQLSQSPSFIRRSKTY